jgi:hypothetical protein
MNKRAICNVCGEPPVTSSEAGDGAVIWFCPNHLDPEASEAYEELAAEGFEIQPRKTIH